MATKRANGEGNIRKKTVKGKTYWEGRYTGADGKQHSVSGKTQSEVRTKLQARLKECEDELVQKENKSECKLTNDMILNEAYDLYCSIYNIDLKPQSVYLETYNYNNHVRSSLGQVQILKIDSMVVQKWINSLVKKGLASSTIQLIVNITKKVFTYMWNEGIIRSNPFKSIKITGKHGKQKRELTDEEINVFYNTAEQVAPIICPVIILLLNTGMRIGELIAATWKDISKDGLYLTINKTWTQYKDLQTGKMVNTVSTPKTEKGSRIIPLSPEVQQYLQKLKAEQKDKLKDQWNSSYNIILSTRNRPLIYQNVSRLFGTVNKCIQKDHKDFINITPHYFRHTFASRAINQNIPELYIQYICGWSSLDMLHETYGHVTPQQAMNALKEFDSGKTI